MTTDTTTLRQKIEEAKAAFLESEQDDEAFVSFDYDGIRFNVDEMTDVDLLLRDYETALIFDALNEVGPETVEKYRDDIQAALLLTREQADALEEIRPGVFRMETDENSFYRDIIDKARRLAGQKFLDEVDPEVVPVVEFENSYGPLTIRVDRYTNTAELEEEYFFCTHNKVQEMGPKSRPRVKFDRKTFWPQEDGTTIMDVIAGDTLDRVLITAKAYASSLMQDNMEEAIAPVVQIRFNDVTIKVNHTSNLDRLQRDYRNALRLRISEIGPDTLDEVPEEMQQALEDYEREAEERRKAWQEEAKKAREAKEAEIAKLTEGQELAIKPGLEEEYADYVEKNSEDDYSRACVTFGERWALLMQAKIEEGSSLEEVAEEMSRTADSEGITGFMYGCAVQALAHFWVHGDDLKVWHNAQYGVTDPDAKGTVNPAIINVGITGG